MTIKEDIKELTKWILKEVKPYLNYGLIQYCHNAISIVVYAKIVESQRNEETPRVKILILYQQAELEVIASSWTRKSFDLSDPECVLKAIARCIDILYCDYVIRYGSQSTLVPKYLLESKERLKNFI